jgi:hypothetical protein
VAGGEVQLWPFVSRGKVVYGRGRCCLYPIRMNPRRSSRGVWATRTALRKYGGGRSRGRPSLSRVRTLSRCTDAIDSTTSAIACSSRCPRMPADRPDGIRSAPGKRDAAADLGTERPRRTLRRRGDRRRGASSALIGPPAILAKIPELPMPVLKHQLSHVERRPFAGREKLDREAADRPTEGPSD